MSGLQLLNLPADAWRQTLTVATAFWALCLGLVVIEATLGDNIVTGTVFFLSLPALVGFLFWANKTLLGVMRRGLVAMVAFGMYVLVAASAIVFVGLFAAANLKNIIVAV